MRVARMKDDSGFCFINEPFAEALGDGVGEGRRSRRSSQLTAVGYWGASRASRLLVLGSWLFGGPARGRSIVVRYWGTEVCLMDPSNASEETEFSREYVRTACVRLLRGTGQSLGWRVGCLAARC